MNPVVKATICLILFLSTSAWAAEKTAFVFYYPWYLTPEIDGRWYHWNANRHRPPEDLASTHFPKLGPYSSNDAVVVDQHMRWIKEAKIDVLIYSWWGRKDPTDKSARLVLDRAADHGLKVAFMIEIYQYRTPIKMYNDIRYLNSTYGNHPAFFRRARRTRYGRTDAPRGVFFIYQPQYPDKDLQWLCDTIHSGPNNSIVLLQSNDPKFVGKTHADGLFLYQPVDPSVTTIYHARVEEMKKRKDIYIPSVSPGFNRNREARADVEPYRSRKQGKTYDEWWTAIIESNPEFVSIISFNEWHEGTQIEPAIRKRRADPPYLSYERTYGLTGDQAEFSYLRQTARWIEQFKMLP